METKTETAPAPQLTIISRVAAIPLVEDALTTIHSTLTNNPYTSSPYSTAQGLSKAALGYTEPIQKRLAPLIVRADSLANQGLDVVQSRYPYPFQTHAGDLVKDLRGRSDQAYNVANKTIDERVKTPAYSVAQGIDQRLSPIVDYFEGAVNKLHPNGSVEHQTADSQFQYQRALALSKDLSGHLYVYSQEQINQLKEQSVLVQRATETAHNLTATASSGIGAAQARVHTLSDNMLAELQKIQAQTAQLPGTLQASFHDISTHLSSTIHDLSTILTSQDPLQDKVVKVKDTVQERVQPILELATARVQEILGLARQRVTETGKELDDAVTNGAAALGNGNGNGSVNGNGNGNGHA